MKTIHLFHTNDIHSHFEYWPQIHRFLIDKRNELEAKHESVFVFDIGDHVDRFHPFTEATGGKGNVQLLNKAQYDAVTIGNNEGITMSNEALSSLYDEASFDVILGNLKDLNGKTPTWLKPYRIYEIADEFKIGLVAATAYYKEFYHALDWEVSPPRTELMKQVKAIKDECDVIICLSHLGIHEDRLLAEQCPHIDVILGAHTHHVLPEGEVVNNSLIAAAGKFGDYIGHVTIQVDCQRKRIEKKKAGLIQSANLQALPSDRLFLDQTIHEGKDALQEPVFYNSFQMKQNLFGQSELSSFFGRALLSYTEADCALFNAGIFLGSLKKGWITKGDIHRLLPHPINVCTIELTGKQLIHIYEQSLNRDLHHIKVRGLGFRGTIMGTMIHERLYQNHKGRLFVGNQEVDVLKKYRLATLDMFTFGFFFPLFKELTKEYYMPDLIRDVFIRYATK